MEGLHEFRLICHNHYGIAPFLPDDDFLLTQTWKVGFVEVKSGITVVGVRRLLVEWTEKKRQINFLCIALGMQTAPQASVLLLGLPLVEKFDATKRLHELMREDGDTIELRFQEYPEEGRLL